jgi:hypothetical protein
MDGNGNAPGYVLFVWSPAGYTLAERQGEPPRVGDELEADGQTLVITKVGASPLPGDARACAYSVGKG